MLYLRLAIDNIFSQIKRFLLSLLLVSASLVVITYIVLIYAGQGYGYSSSDKLLAQGFEKTGVLSFEEISDDIDFKGFWNEAYMRNEIYTLGNMELAIGAGDFSKDIMDIQGKNTQGKFLVKEGAFSYIAMDVRSLRVCDIEILEGIDIDKLDFSKDSDTYILTYLYLGSAYKSIPVGTEYRIDTPRYSYVYKVAGVLKEGQKWIYPELHLGISFEDSDYTIDCKYGVFAIENMQGIPSDLWIVANDRYTIMEAIEAAYEVADKYGIDMTYTTLTDVYENYCQDTVMFLSYLGEAMAVIIPAIVLMLIAMQIVSIMLELRSYGIMCAFGYSLKDINIVIIIKNLIMSLVSMVIATPIVLWIAKKQYVEDFKKVMETIMLPKALPIGILILVVIMLITSATSVIMLRRYTPVKLMEKRN